MSRDTIIICDEAAEAGALACVLSASNGEAERMFYQLNRGDFYDERHTAVFEALNELDWDNHPLSVVELVQRLKDRRSPNTLIEYVSQLPDSTPSPANFPSYLGTVRDRAARREKLAQLERDKLTVLDLSQPFDGAATADQLAERAFHFACRPADVVPVFNLCGNPVSTAGNLTSIVSQAKTGKSAVVQAMFAAAISPDPEGRDFLGFTSANPERLAILHLDTEQAPADHWHGVERACRRAGLIEPPEWLLSFYLTGLMPNQAWRAAQEAIRRAASHSPEKRLHSVLIDGVGDLVHDVNDAGECNDFVAALHGLAIEHACPIVGVLHFNPESAKARGHLGSQLERKSESNLRLDKEDEFTVLWSNKQRRSPIPRDFGPRFTWNDEAGMHMTVESRSEARRSAKAEAAIPARDDAFHEHPAMRYNDLIEAVKTTAKVGQRTAERRVQEWTKLGVIEKSVANLWTPKG
jgi:hypothetical protein